MVTEDNGNKIGKITLGGHDHRIPDPDKRQLAAFTDHGRAGRESVFTESTTNKIGKITTSGVITEYLVRQALQPLRIHRRA